ncbi:MAG TPA: phosphate ABC transporter permease PstA [Candidatus Angelobacter sp.]|nr:phosphate ABC transporter permease PstA [Candidatus Angelobacter sp.]
MARLRGHMPKKQLQTIPWWRRAKNFAAIGSIGLATVIVILPLVLILGTVLYKGIGSLDWNLFTQIPKPAGELGGGMANGIAGSVMILMIASIIGIPLGIGSGVFLAEYGRNIYGNIVRFTADVLNGVPSIVIGLTAYALVVVVQGHFSLLAGGIALGIMMIPTVSRTTEEVLLMVPQTIREAALGLGIPHWRTTLSVVLPSARSGIITSIMLAFARIAGETAPLMFTAFGNQFWSTKLNQPTAALPLQIFTYAVSGFEDQRRQAWAGAFVLIVMIVGTVLIVRFITSRGALKGAN